MSNQLVSKRYSCFIHNVECLVSSISQGLRTLLVFAMRLELCNECYRVWNLSGMCNECDRVLNPSGLCNECYRVRNPFPGCFDSKPRYLGSLSRTGSARCTTID